MLSENKEKNGHALLRWRKRLRCRTTNITSIKDPTIYEDRADLTDIERSTFGQIYEKERIYNIREDG